MRLSHWFVISCSFGAGVACAFGLAAVFPLSPNVNSRPIVESGRMSPSAVEDGTVVPVDTFVPVKVMDTVVEETGMEYPVLVGENEKYGRNMSNEVAADIPTDKGDMAPKTVPPNILYFGVDHYPLSPNTLRMLEQYKTTAVHGGRNENDQWDSADIGITDSLADSPSARVRQYQIPRPIDRVVRENEDVSDAEKDTATLLLPPSSTNASYFRKR